MKKYLLFFIYIFIISCAVNDGVYWCGDHPCINKKEKEELYGGGLFQVSISKYLD